MKYWSVIVVFLFLISFFFLFDDEENTSALENNDKETRAVYFSYIEFENFIKGKSDEEQKKNIINVLDNLKNNNLNRIIVHTRPFGDSIYKSNYFPMSDYILNDKNENPSYDILKFFIDEAHKRGIKFDAWINPYRISNSKDVSSLKENSIYYQYPDSKVTDKGIYLNPANDEVKKLIVDGIKEIVENYHIDGIHFDDYFYPDDKIDQQNYDEYVKNGGKDDIETYRLNNVKTLLKEVNSSIKEINDKVVFGIAPEGNIDNCYNSFLDVKEILSDSSYIDYVMPQIYYGFNNQTRPFDKTIKEWSNLIKDEKIKLLPALALYKSGNNDSYALSGKNEWIENSDIIKREIELSRTIPKYDGFSLYSYDYLFNKDYQNDNTRNEIDNIRKVLD